MGKNQYIIQGLRFLLLVVKNTLNSNVCTGMEINDYWH